MNADRQSWVVSPSLPLLATMLAGTWLGWTWFAVNAIGLRGDGTRAQLRLLAIGLVVASAMAIGLYALLGIGVLSLRAFKYCAIALVAWKLWIGYRLSTAQRVDHQLFEIYGGVTRNGSGVLIAGLMLRGYVLGALPDGWWILVLA
ncbi:MAG: hypothetical protein IAG13_14290 [Deltaproteobacteria bacterium]|nr:hypothetical protein [Nannocystaceae bacterium]